MNNEQEPTQLEDIMNLYLTAKTQKPDKEFNVTPYIMQYMKLRDSGLQHYPTLQIMYLEHLGVDYINEYRPTSKTGGDEK